MGSHCFPCNSSVQLYSLITGGGENTVLCRVTCVFSAHLSLYTFCNGVRRRTKDLLRSSYTHIKRNNYNNYTSYVNNSQQSACHYKTEHLLLVDTKWIVPNIVERYFKLQIYNIYIFCMDYWLVVSYSTHPVITQNIGTMQCTS